MSHSSSSSSRRTYASGTRVISRRSALAGLGAAGVGNALASRLENGAGAQDASIASHPIVGTWLAIVAPPTSPDTSVVVLSTYHEDGSMVTVFPATEAGPDGVAYRGTALGRWEVADEQTAHATFVLSLANAEGVFVGTMTFDVHPEVSEDGQTFQDVNPENLVTVRGADHTIVSEFPGASPNQVRGYRMTPGHAGFPAADAEATPS
jgi:hypothetical protein